LLLLLQAAGIQVVDMSAAAAGPIGNAAAEQLNDSSFVLMHLLHGASAPAKFPAYGKRPAPSSPSSCGAVTVHVGKQRPTPEQQKQFLGERLFPRIWRLQPELAGKVTGMLLEMDNSAVRLLLKFPEALVAKVDEAIEVLKQHNSI
jgi:hypothetical protein